MSSIGIPELDRRLAATAADHPLHQRLCHRPGMDDLAGSDGIEGIVAKRPPARAVAASSRLVAASPARFGVGSLGDVLRVTTASPATHTPSLDFGALGPAAGDLKRIQRTANGMTPRIRFLEAPAK